MSYRLQINLIENSNSFYKYIIIMFYILINKGKKIPIRHMVVMHEALWILFSLLITENYRNVMANIEHNL